MPILTSQFDASGTELEVCQDIARRQRLGIAKYGKTVADNPLSLKQWLQHAYEETLDKAVYLKRAIAEVESTKKLNDAKDGIIWTVRDWFANGGEMNLPAQVRGDERYSSTRIRATDPKVEVLIPQKDGGIMGNLTIDGTTRLHRGPIRYWTIEPGAIPLYPDDAGYDEAPYEVCSIRER